jgi:hypothetical protein
MTKEIFKAIIGYEGIYEVSNYGNIKKIKSNIISRGWMHCKYGHRKVRLYKDNIRKDFYLHRLVAIAFVDKIDGKNCINHIDNNPDNNYYTNLEWCTQKENMQHAAKQGRMKNHNTKMVLNVKTGIYYNSISEAAESINIKPNALTCQFRRKANIDFVLVNNKMQENGK